MKGCVREKRPQSGRDCRHGDIDWWARTCHRQTTRGCRHEQRAMGARLCRRRSQVRRSRPPAYLRA